MKSFYAFLRKERMEQLRTGKVLILLILFTLFGIMNPAIARLTPWMMEVLSGSLAEAGMTVTGIMVNALTSWTQFYKNIPLALLVFVLMMSSIFTAEYQKGTLVLVFTKGLRRTKVLAAKALTLLVLWTAVYFLCYGVTYGYTALFWDQAIMRHLAFTACAYWLFGVWVISVLLLFSTLSTGNTGVLLGTGGTVLASYLLGLLPGWKPFLPLYLTNSLPLLTGELAASSMLRAVAVTLALTALHTAASIFLFRRRSI